MNFSVLIDWKLAVAFGAAVCGIILSVKIDSEAAEEVSIHAIDACKECAVAVSGNR